jgi:hypothetical protein
MPSLCNFTRIAIAATCFCLPAAAGHAQTDFATNAEGIQPRNAPLLGESPVKVQPTPFTVRFDPSSILAERPQTTLPLWLRGVSVKHAPAAAGRGQTTSVRFDIRRIASLAPFVEIRTGLAPGIGQASVSAWTETGTEVFRSAPFGSASEFVSESVRVPFNDADYIELELPKNGERLGSLTAAAMRYSQVLQAVDFPQDPLADAFGNGTRTTPASETDRILWNRVLALLDSGSFALHPTGGQNVEFEISARPLCALLSFEIRNSSGEAPPLIRLNEAALPSASLVLPDLADPAWRGTSIPGTELSVMRYTGWMRVQQYIPGDLLSPGTNLLSFSLPALPRSETEEIRRLEIQLKYKR